MLNNLFCVESRTVPVMCWADSLYVVGKSAQRAIDSIEHIGRDLKVWALHLKPGSKSYRLPKNSELLLNLTVGVGHQAVLGQSVDNNGSIKVDVNQGIRAAWRACY